LRPSSAAEGGTSSPDIALIDVVDFVALAEVDLEAFVFLPNFFCDTRLEMVLDVPILSVLGAQPSRHAKALAHAHLGQSAFQAFGVHIEHADPLDGGNQFRGFHLGGRQAGRIGPFENRHQTFVIQAQHIRKTG
jgi:hypothetical protein